eukprot:TRINITY_DN22838_c0_g1_i1.p1 TRINITY_DN22838_c0_g1~~TRINITY_DN22838_c0_g1_i1.p1  ORF type:complete len:551 (+),score=71.15 TRINITY_DN22838_c0_g1_i1:42-1655(+)
MAPCTTDDHVAGDGDVGCQRNSNMFLRTGKYEPLQSDTAPFASVAPATCDVPQKTDSMLGQCSPVHDGTSGAGFRQGQQEQQQQLPIGEGERVLDATHEKATRAADIAAQRAIQKAWDQDENMPVANEPWSFAEKPDPEAAIADRQPGRWLAPQIAPVRGGMPVKIGSDLLSYPRGPPAPLIRGGGAYFCGFAHGSSSTDACHLYTTLPMDAAASTEGPRSAQRTFAQGVEWQHQHQPQQNYYHDGSASVGVARRSTRETFVEFSGVWNPERSGSSVDGVGGRQTAGVECRLGKGWNGKGEVLQNGCSERATDRRFQHGQKQDEKEKQEQSEQTDYHHNVPPSCPGFEVSPICQWHESASLVGSVSGDGHVFTKREGPRQARVSDKGDPYELSTLCMVFDASLRCGGVHRYQFHVLAGDLGPADGAGFTFDSRVRRKPIQQMSAVFMNKRGTICFRQKRQVHKLPARLPPLSRGSILTMLVDLNLSQAKFFVSRDNAVLGSVVVDLAEQMSKVGDNSTLRSGFFCAVVTTSISVGIF